MPYVCLKPSCSIKLPSQRGQDCRISGPESHEAQDSLQEPCQRPLLVPEASVFLTHHEVHFRCLELWVLVSSHQICFPQKKTCALGMSIFVDLELRGKKKMSPSSQMASGSHSRNHCPGNICHSWHDVKGLPSPFSVCVCATRCLFCILGKAAPDIMGAWVGQQRGAVAFSLWGLLP